jgi:Flp pilus assembly protein TadB
MGTVPTADLIAVIIGIAVVVMAVAASMAPVIIVVAIVLLVPVSVVLSHSDCRRESQRHNCGRGDLEPGLD